MGLETLGILRSIIFNDAVGNLCYQSSLRLPITLWETAINQKRPYLYIISTVRSIAFIFKKQKFENSILKVLTCNHRVNEITNVIKNQILKICSILNNLIKERRWMY